MKSKIYYNLYDRFAKILLKHNPCQFEDGKCIVNKGTIHFNGCCKNCDLNTVAGCSVQSLACKSFLCERAFYNLPKSAQSEWRDLIEIKEKYFPNLKNIETWKTLK